MKLCLSCNASFIGATWVCPECSWSPESNGLLKFAPSQEASTEHFPRDAVARMSELERSHFWFTARNELIVWLISHHFPGARNLLEVGCGTGVVLSRIRELRPDLELTGADLLSVALHIAQERVPGAAVVQADICRIPFREEFDIVCALDVLEHVDGDASAMDQIADAVRPGGGVVVSVPQHDWLWSAADEFGRHRRRYSRRALMVLLDAAGFTATRITSSVALLLPVVAASRLRRRRLTAAYDPFRELDLPASANRLFGSVMTLERRLIRAGVSFPLGSSLIAVGVKR